MDEENETNKIYGYLGTYKYTDEICVVHSAAFTRTKYDDKKQIIECTVI